jgi:threonine aldolase
MTGCCPRSQKLAAKRSNENERQRMNDFMNKTMVRQLASDTYAGICPVALQALQEANTGHAAAYGDDPWTARAVTRFQEFFETDCHVSFVLTGTAANSLALAALCQSYHSVLCHTDAHVQTDECGGPEYAASGIKLLPVAGPDGKLAPALIRQTVSRRRDVHSHKPHVLSLSQATEVGTVYSVSELTALGAVARELDLLVHVDGARFANALATLRVPPRRVTWEVGVDVLCFGGTKNGLAAGDAIVFFNHALARDFEYRRKQAGHLLAKMRFLAAPWAALLESGVWLRNAEHANEMARILAKEMAALPGVRVLYPVEANAVFVRLPQPWIAALHERGWHFYTIADGERLMCSWDTDLKEIQAFVQDLREVAANSSSSPR